MASPVLGVMAATVGEGHALQLISSALKVPASPLLSETVKLRASGESCAGSAHITRELSSN